jgi:hypothetical protein
MISAITTETYSLIKILPVSKRHINSGNYKFWKLFHTDSSYQQLDERKQLTLVKISELLYVLEYPELGLHNNPAELGARTMYGAARQY